MIDQIQEQQATQAGLERRIAAFFIDHLVLTLLMVCIVFMAVGTEFMNEEGVFKMMLTMFLVMLPGMFLYFAKDSVRGNSIGKWIMGIMVRDEHDNNAVPSFGRLLGRNLLLMIWPVEFIILITGNDRKRLGDKAFKTVVLQNPHKPKKLPRILTLATVAAVFGCFLIFFIASTMKSSDAYKVSIAEIELNDKIIEETGGIKGFGFIPKGNIQIYNGQGQAQLEIRVLGNEKDVIVTTYLEKEPGREWHLVEMY